MIIFHAACGKDTQDIISIIIIWSGANVADHFCCHMEKKSTCHTQFPQKREKERERAR